MKIRVLSTKYEIVKKLNEDSKRHFFSSEIPKWGGNKGTEIVCRERNMEDIFRERTSIRFFDEKRSVEYADLIAILKKNVTFYRKNWPSDHGLGIELEQYVLLERVEGCDLHTDRFYKLCSATNKLILVSDKVITGSKEEIVLQREFAAASVIILFVGRLEKAIELHGSDAYRKMLTKAGATAQYAWLQTLGLGYSGTVFAGTLPRALKTTSDVDGYRKCQLFAFSFGYPLNTVLKGGEDNGRKNES